MTSIHKILFLFLFLYAGNICAQEKTDGSKQKNTVDSKSFNLMGLSDYFISGETSGNTYVFTMYSVKDEDKGSEKTTFTLRPLTKESFIQNFFSNLATFKKMVKAPDNKIPIVKYDPALPDSIRGTNYKKIEEEATKLFYMFVAGSIVNDDLKNEPIAGTIYYKDNLLVLRRDVDHQSIHSRIDRSWKVYKQDKKSIKKMLKTGLLDDKLDTDDEITKDIINLKINEYNKNAKKKSSSDTISISKKSDIAELFANLNRRKFTKKKDKEFLQKRALKQQEQFEETKRELSKTNNKLKDENESLQNFKNISGIIDSIILIEKRKTDFYNKLTIAFNNIKSYQKTIRYSFWPIYDEYIDMERPDTNSLDLYNLSIVSVLECLQIKEFDTIDNTVTQILKLDQCESLIKILNGEISKIEKEVIKELQNDSITLTQKVGLTKVNKNLGRVKKIMQDSLPNNITSYHDNAQELVKLYENQLLISKEIIEPFMKDFIQLLLKGTNDGLVTSGISVSIPDWIKEKQVNSYVSNTLQEWETLKIDFGLVDSIAIVNTRIGVLEEIRRKNIEQFHKQEDQLIFKGFKVDSIVIEINEGFIENILVVGEVNEYTNKYGRLKVPKDGKVLPSPRTLKFENSSPIGFSRKLDFDAIKGKKLYTRGGGRTQYEMHIEDLLDIYIQEHEVGRRDYSPANQKVVLKKGDGKKMKLKKEATYRLFEAKIYSDFVGLDETAPNGLIQTEVSKRINLLTSRKPFQFFSLAGLSNEWNVGFFSFLEPSLTLSKIEGNNKYLNLENKDRFINNKYTPIKYASTLSLKQYENFSAGATANILLLDMPNIKSTFFVNWGFRYGRTGIQDSIRTATTNGLVQVNAGGVNDYGVNTFDHSPELMWNIYADERYGFSMSWQHHWFYLRDNQFEQVANTTFFENQVINSIKDSKQFNSFRFLTTLEQSSNNKGRLFFRYTYNWQQGFWRTGFHQAQVGYSFFLLGRPKDKKG